MSTVDEVLATAEVVDAVCVIDGETRIISVPNEYKELGVESDEKVTRIKFRCPKIVGDNVDLTEYNLYINYRNAGNKLNSYLVEDVTVTGDTINFSWLLSRHVTENPGTISYIVCAKKSDDTGVINEWNTKVATGIIGIGLEATEEIEEQSIDAIEQILRSIVDLENKVDSGEAGGYYVPAVDAGGNLSWTASKADMPAVDGANIKGARGETGAKGENGSKGDKGETGANGKDGADGKSAYAYAVEGGYTGTEAEFAAKLAAEKFANPNALTFTGAVSATYDGSAPVSVEIPSGGGSSGGSTAEWQLLGTYTMLVSDRRLVIDLSQFEGITHFRIIGNFPKCSEDCGSTYIYLGTALNHIREPINHQNVYAFSLLAECELVDGQLYGFIGTIDGWNFKAPASVVINTPRDSRKNTNLSIYYANAVNDTTENTIQIWGY